MQINDNREFYSEYDLRIARKAVMKEPARSPGNGYRSFDQVVSIKERWVCRRNPCITYWWWQDIYWNSISLLDRII